MKAYKCEKCSYKRGPQIFQKSRSHLKIAGSRRMKRSRLRIKDPEILGATVQNSVARDVWTPEL
jgi:C4-type Zn-finger protein